MKGIFFIALILLPFITFSQSFNTVYYNQRWELTSINSAKYYRNSGFNSKSLKFDSLVIDHYMNGNIEMTGNYSGGLKNGDFIYYYSDGQVKLVSHYLNNERQGIWTSYFENGQMNKSIEYKDGREQLLKYYTEKGEEVLKELSGLFSLQFFVNLNYHNISEKQDSSGKKYLLSGNLKNGLKNGLWTVKEFIRVSSNSGRRREPTETPRVLFRFNYSDGVLISGDYSRTYQLHEAISYDTLSFLIFEPEKIFKTEAFFAEPGQLIKQNYVIKALKDREEGNSPIPLDTYKEIPSFFRENFSAYFKNCSDTLTIKIKVRFDNQDRVMLESITPQVGSSIINETQRIINKISKVIIHLENYIFSYHIKCFDDLDYKR